MNSKLWEYKFKEFSFEILEFCLGILDLRCPLNFALAAEKTRLQDFLLRTRWVSNFYFKAAALAVGSQQLQKFCAEFSRRKPQKNSAKVFAKWLGCAAKKLG